MAARRSRRVLQSLHAYWIAKIRGPVICDKLQLPFIYPPRFGTSYPGALDIPGDDQYWHKFLVSTMSPTGSGATRSLSQGGETLLKGAHWPPFGNAIISSQKFTYITCIWDLVNRIRIRISEKLLSIFRGLRLMENLLIAQSSIYYFRKRLFSLLCHDSESVYGVISVA